jgi:magnesium chelatase family protein
MNPYKCGYLVNPALACGRESRCAADYQSKISGPLFDRIDLHVDVPAVKPAYIAVRVAAAARAVQAARFEKLVSRDASGVSVNAHADGELLDAIATPDAADRLHLSARGWHRIRRVARTIADLDGSEGVRRVHIAEALGYRRIAPGR